MTNKRAIQELLEMRSGCDEEDPNMQPAIKALEYAIHVLQEIETLMIKIEDAILYGVGAE